MIICEICFVLLMDGSNLGWPQIPLNGGTPIYLPVTHPDWNSPHAHSPDDQAEAEARLPAALPRIRWDAYAEGFQEELQQIIYDLVGTDPQHLFRLSESDTNSEAALDWPGMSLLQLMAVDPNIARILGLYWHDEPPADNKFYDYRVIGHYVDTPVPGRHVDFSGLDPAMRYGTLLEHEGLTFVSPSPMEAVRTIWDGSDHTALLFTRDIPGSPISISLPESVASVTLHMIADGIITVRAFLGYKVQSTEIQAAGEVTFDIDDYDGINKLLLLPAGEVSLVELVLRRGSGGIGDLVYDVFHLRTNTGSAVSVPRLEAPQVIETPTGLDENGVLMPHQNRVDLRWERREAGASYLQADAPVLFQVQREDLDEEGQKVLQTSIVNEDAPTLLSERLNSGVDSPLYSDRSVPDGIYRYAVRGADLFSVLGDWSQSEQIEVFDQLAPPPPQGVKALYLDAADPWLSQEDRDWAASNGPGLKLGWHWPGMFMLQAPDVAAPQAEFRVYAQQGALNRLDGFVSAVAANGSTSEVITDINWQGASGSLAGEKMRINQDFFEVVTHTNGPNCVFTVNNLTLPALVPGSGPCSLTISPQNSNWSDYRAATKWQRRLHVEPVQDAPIVSAQVSGVDDFDAAEIGAVISRAGATRTVTISQGLLDPDGFLLPGVLLCDSIVYAAYGHTPGSALRIHIVPVASPADRTLPREPQAGASCTYYPGRRYEVKITDFELVLPSAQASATATVAISCSDGKAHIGDRAVWSRPGRGGLGNRPGNESALSTAVTVQAIRRAPPQAVSAVPAAPADPIFADPANYYGQARYTLTWEAVPDTAGYALFRCSGAALFDQDRALRQNQKDHYQGGSVFADDPGFAAWLAGFDPALTEAELLSRVEDHLDAWRAWAKRFYNQLSDVEVQELANRPGNEAAFRRLNKDAFDGLSYRDTFDGRGQGFYLYRLRTVDAAGNLSAWSDTYPPVHIFDVTPPSTPLISGVFGGEKFVMLTWRANRESDLQEYRIWRDADPANLADVRRTAATATLVPDDETSVTFIDEGLDGLQTYYYRVAAVDTNGNVSEPSRVLRARVSDSIPPIPPLWERAEWIRLDSDANEYAFDDPAAQAFPAAVVLTWLADQLAAEATLERRGQYDKVWFAVATIDEPLDASDLGAEDARRYTYYDMSASASLENNYRVRLKSRAGLINTKLFNETSVQPEAII
jgi:hypothetical protein